MMMIFALVLNSYSWAKHGHMQIMLAWTPRMVGLVLVAELRMLGQLEKGITLISKQMIQTLTINRLPLLKELKRSQVAQKQGQKKVQLHFCSFATYCFMIIICLEDSHLCLFYFVLMALNITLEFCSLFTGYDCHTNATHTLQLLNMFRFKIKRLHKSSSTNSATKTRVTGILEVEDIRARKDKKSLQRSLSKNGKGEKPGQSLC